MRLFLSVLLLATASLAYPQAVSLTTSGSAYTQNFSTLSNTAGSTTNNLTITGWFQTETGGGARDNEQYAVDTGGSNTGDTYSYGAAGNTDRALGGLQSGTLIPVIGASFTNNTGATITSLTIAYTGEQWRIGNAAAARDDRMDFQYSTNATSLTAGTWTDVNELDFTNPVKTAATAGALDGNNAANRTAISHTITGLSIPNGATFWIRWNDLNASGADDGLAVDDFSLTPNGGASQPTLSINDVSTAEGNSGTTNFQFTVSLSAPAPPGGVTFDIATADNTATTAGLDYFAKSLTGQTIPTASTTYTFTVAVNGDTGVEANESFFVNVTNVTGASVADGQGQGIIVNDDVQLVPINSIQGPGATSPVVGTVVTTTGIVTAVRSNGFFIQTPDASVDADPLTSEGILVFTNSAPPAAAVVGSLVQVTGTVTEFIPSSRPGDLPLTEITSPTVVQLSTGNPIPTPVTIAATDSTAAGGREQLERFEGMRVSLPSLTVVAPTTGSITETSATSTSNGVFFGVLPGVAVPFREAGIAIGATVPTCAAGSGCAIPVFDGNPELIRVDSDAAGQAALNVTTGNTVTNLVGVLDYASSSYTVYPTSAPSVAAGSAVTANPIPAPPAGSLSIVSANVLRFFDDVNDPSVGEAVLTAAAYAKRLGKLSLAVRTKLHTPDVLALVEIENLSTAQALADRINADAIAAGQPDPGYIAYLVEGNDVGGIDVAFLVRSTQVSVAEVVQLGKDTTYLRPDNNVAEFLNDRPPLVLRGTATKGAQNLPFTLVVNHLRSLNGIDDESSLSAGPRVRAKRAAQANFLAQLVQDELTANPASRIVLVGDFNAFQVNDGYVDVINAILGSPAPATQVATATTDPAYPNLTNVINLLPAAERYSYVFGGSHQALDHVLLNPAARAHFTGGGYARLNADFPETLYGDGAVVERFSDHDPAYAFLTTAANVTAQAGVTRSGVSYNRTAMTAISRVTVRNNTASTWTGPLNLVITGLPEGVTLTNATSVNGAAYSYALAAPLAPGQSTAVTLNFALKAIVPINYTANVYLGTL